jgi:2,4-dienoyl-CoA reductase [(3E)-enoyl-CoA-producing], peroxisomal
LLGTYSIALHFFFLNKIFFSLTKKNLNKTKTMSASVFKSTALNGKVCLITGGHSGIGNGIAEAMVAHGAKVAMVGRREEVLDTAAAALCKKYGPNVCIGIVGDVRNLKSMQSAVERTLTEYGLLNVLVNCAAGNFLCSAEDLSENGFRTVVEIDLIGTFNASKAAFAALKASGDASILNISATVHYAAVTLQSHPAAAKAGVDSLTRSLANEWGEHGIRVNGVAPGPIGGTEGLMRLVPQGVSDAVAKALPVRRIGSKHDIANACIFLVSDAASFVTGHTLVCDGGHWVSGREFVPRELYEQLRVARRQQRFSKL